MDDVGGRLVELGPQWGNDTFARVDVEVGGTGGGEHAAIGDLDLRTAREQEQQVVCTAIDGRARADTGTESTNGGIEAKDKQAGCERTSLENAAAKSISEGHAA